MAVSTGHTATPSREKEQWLLLDVNCGDVNDNAVCTRNMEEPGFSL